MILLGLIIIEMTPCPQLRVFLRPSSSNHIDTALKYKACISSKRDTQACAYTQSRSVYTSFPPSATAFKHCQNSGKDTLSVSCCNPTLVLRGRVGFRCSHDHLPPHRDILSNEHVHIEAQKKSSLCSWKLPYTPHPAFKDTAA